MSIINFSLIFIGVMLNAFAQLSLKAGTNILGEISIKSENIFNTFFKVAIQPYIVLGLVLYIFSVGIWIVALSKTPVSIAYPMLSMGYIVNLFLAYFLFGEALSFQKILAITIIVIGVYILAKA